MGTDVSTDGQKQDMGPTQMVRNYAAANGVLTKKETRTVLGLTTGQVKSAFDTLIRQGALSRIERGVYRFEDHIQRPGADIVDKIWRAMKLSPVFSVGEIAMLSDSTVAYVYKRFRGYRADGYLKQAGVRRTFGSGQEKLWRLTIKGKDKAQNPNVAVFVPDPLVMATVNLNRLVCSKMVNRDKAAADQALALAEDIKGRVRQLIDKLSD